MTCISDERVRALIDRLQQRSQTQGRQIGEYFERRAQANELSWDGISSVVQ